MARFGLLSVVLVISPSIAIAQDNCSAPLSYQAYDTTKTTTINEFKNDQVRLACRNQWTSVSDFKNAVQGVQTGGGFNFLDIPKANGIANANNAQTTQQIQQLYQNYCIDNRAAFEASLFNTTDSQIADLAVRAWEDCVTHTDGLFSNLHHGPGGDYTITVSYRSSHQNETPFTIAGYDTSQPVTCNIAGHELKNFIPIKNNVQFPFGINCNLTSDKSVSLAINTNDGQIGPFDLETKALVDLTKRVEDLEAAKSILTKQVGNLEATKLSARSGDDHNAEPDPNGDPNFIVQGGCSTNEIVTGYYCQVDSGGGFIQNFGTSDSKQFSCLWSGGSAATRDKSKFSAHGHALCLRLAQ